MLNSCSWTQDVRGDGRLVADHSAARTTPRLLSLYSLTTLLAAQLTPEMRQALATCAWCRRPHPTCSDTFAAVRREVWREQGVVTSAGGADLHKLPPALREAITHALCHAAF